MTTVFLTRVRIEGNVKIYTTTTSVTAGTDGWVSGEEGRDVRKGAMGVKEKTRERSGVRGKAREAIC